MLGLKVSIKFAEHIMIVNCVISQLTQFYDFLVFRTVRNYQIFKWNISQALVGLTSEQYFMENKF